MAQTDAATAETTATRVRRETGELLRLAGPVVMARLGIMTMGLVDAIIVGRHSSEQLAFHALAWAPTSVVLTTAVGLLIGVQVMTARLLGEGRGSETGAVFRRGVVYAFWIGVVSTVAMIALGPLFIGSIGLEPALAKGAGEALLVFALSLTPYLVSVAATFYLEALSRPGPGMWIMWIANIANLALNLLLVPGTFGLPALGAVGSAWSTFGARILLMAMMLAYIWRMSDARALGVFNRPVGGRAEAAEQRRVGYGAGASYFVEVAAFAGMSFVTGLLGAAVLAAWTVVLNVSAVIFMVPLGLSAATGVLVGRAFGARDPAGVRRGGWIGVGVALAFGLIVSLLVWPLAPALAGAYSRDPALIALAAPALVLACLFFAADSIQVVAAQALRARGDIWPPTITHVISYAIVMGPLAWWLSHSLGMGLTGVMWAVILASLMAAAFLTGRFWQLGRRGL